MEKEKKFFHIPPEQEPIGVGAERKVWQDPHRPDRVIGILRQGETTPPVAVANYYFNKILHLLFPKNIPDIWLSSPRATAREKKNLGWAHNAMQKAEIYYREGRRDEDEHIPPEVALESNKAHDLVEEDGDRKRFIKILDALRVSFDATDVNFGKDEQGNIIYVEPVKALKDITMWRGDRQVHEVRINADLVKLGRMIKKLDPAQQQKATAYLERLTKAAERKQAELNKTADQRRPPEKR